MHIHDVLYDGQTQVWGTAQTGVQEGGRHAVNFITTFNFNNFCADDASGNVYYMTTGTYTDNGQPRLREISSTHIHDNGNEFSIPMVWFDMVVGQGPQTGQGQKPSMMMTVSKDGGMTWGNELITSLGSIGRYGTRPIFRRLGKARDFILKLRVTDPVPFIMNKACYIPIWGSEHRQDERADAP